MPDDFKARPYTQPREGYFALRAWPRGPLKPARIYRPLPIEPGTTEVLDRWPRLVAEIDGEIVDDLYAIWLYAKEVTEEEFDFITAITWPKYRDQYYAERTSSGVVYRNSEVSIGGEEPEEKPHSEGENEKLWNV